MVVPATRMMRIGHLIRLGMATSTNWGMGWKKAASALVAGITMPPPTRIRITAKPSISKPRAVSRIARSLPFKEAFDALQASVGQADPAAYLKANYWDAVTDNWSRGVSMTIQMMMLAEEQGKLVDGWHLLARLHILEREFNRAIANDAAWDSKKVSLGFASFTRTEAAALSSNDWMVIAVSQVTGLDYRDYLTMWGIAFSSKAAEQVASFSYAVCPA